MAGILGPLALAAHAVMLNMAMLTFPLLDGIGTAILIRVGQRLGDGDGPGARMTAQLGMVLIMAVLIPMGKSSLAPHYLRLDGPFIVVSLCPTLRRD